MIEPTIPKQELDPLYDIVLAALEKKFPELANTRAARTSAWTAVDLFVFGGHTKDLHNIGIDFQVIHTRGEMTDRDRFELLKIVLQRFAAKTVY